MEEDSDLEGCLPEEGLVTCLGSGGCRPERWPRVGTPRLVGRPERGGAALPSLPPDGSGPLRIEGVQPPREIASGSKARVGEARGWVEGERVRVWTESELSKLSAAALKLGRDVSADQKASLERVLRR